MLVANGLHEAGECGSRTPRHLIDRAMFCFVEIAKPAGD